MNKFSDFADPSVAMVMDGKKVQLNDILDKEIVVLRYRVKKTKFSEAKNPDCLTVQFAYPDNEDVRFVFFSGSSVLMQQLEKYKDKIPFTATIKKVAKYYTFS